MTGVKLEKIFDIAMYLFIEKGLRGGVSHIAIDTVKQIINRWKVMSLTYLNMNNLYDWEKSD